MRHSNVAPLFVAVLPCLVTWIIFTLTMGSSVAEAATLRDFLREIKSLGQDNNGDESSPGQFIQPLPDDNENDNNGGFISNSGGSSPFIPVVEETEDGTTPTTPTTDTTTTPTTPFTCPEMGPDLFCTMEWMPVLCDGVCAYGNLCEATASGYDEAQCQPYDESGESATAVPTAEATVSDTENNDTNDCPVMPAGTFCSLHWEPFVCDNGRCSYGNRCEASTAGYDVTTQCLPGEF